MIGRDEMVAALHEHVESIVQGVDTAGSEMTADLMCVGLGVDRSALEDIAVVWTSTPGGSEAEGFMNGFLVACRVLRERSGTL